MNPHLTARRPTTGRLGRVVALAALSLTVAVAAAVNGSTPALASTAAGAVQLTVPPGGLGAGTPLTSGGSATPFAMTPPTGAACSGDSATGGYRVQSFMVPSTVDVSTLTFNASGPIPSGSGASYRQPMYSSTGTPFVNKTTGASTGALAGLPTFSFAFLPDATATFLPVGTYTIGYACTLGPAGPTQLDKYWTAQITISAAPSDPLGIAWAIAVAPPPTTSTSSTTSTSTTSSTLPTSTTLVAPTTSIGGESGSNLTNTGSNVWPGVFWAVLALAFGYIVVLIAKPVLVVTED